MKKYITLCLGILLFLSPALTTVADTPSVVSFSAPTSLNSGQVASFAWTINGGGHGITIFCSQGIKLLYASTNQTFPCDTETSVSAQASDGVSVIVANVSGDPRILTVQLTPKDASGADYPAGAKQVSIYVNPSQEPVSTFYTDATTTASGALTNFYWTSPYLDGVNFKIACNNSITATSSLYGSTIIPCGQTIFATDLPGSGSLPIQFKNSSSVALPLDVTILPAMSPGVYDGTHTSTITLMVASDAQKPVSLSSFSASRQKVFSGDSVSFYWSYANATAVNFKLSCSTYGTYSIFSSATTTALPCNTYAWADGALGPTGSTSITFYNPGLYDQISTVSIFPELKDMTYNGSQAANIQIDVAPTTAIAPTSTPSASATLSATASVGTTNPTGGCAPGNAFNTETGLPCPQSPNTGSTVPAPSASLATNTFTRPLGVGSRGADVTALQTYLATDPSVYPGGYVTGYFGAITEQAVGKFQLKYSIVNTTQDPGYGFVGPKTRLFLNSL